MAILADLTARTHSLVPVINSLNLLILITDSITPTAHTSVGLLTFTLGLTITCRLHAKGQPSNDQWGRTWFGKLFARHFPLPGYESFCCLSYPIFHPLHSSQIISIQLLSAKYSKDRIFPK